MFANLKSLFLSSAILGSSLASLEWKYANPYTNKPTSPLGEAVTITTPPETDIWRPSFTLEANNFTAPYLYTELPTTRFRRLRATFTAPWKTQYDQGGLVLTFPQNAAYGPSTSAHEEPLRWLKAGIEFFQGAPNLGVVATDRLSDWSLGPLPTSANGQATLEVEKNGTDAWVYVIEEGSKRALRQVTWAFNDKVGDRITAGLYAAKPTYDAANVGGDGTLSVNFESVMLELE